MRVNPGSNGKEFYTRRLVAVCGAAFIVARASASFGAVCGELGHVDFSGIVDAPTQLITARLVGATEGLPAYCQLQGYITPNIGFELRLPAAKWNKKFLEVGCGGFCGSTAGFLPQCDVPLLKGYACIASDLGHQSTIGDAKWGYNNLQAKIDFGYRASHVVAVAGKAITAHYYSEAPTRSYFMGCSGGGRQGMVEAQRFPWDFDGIIAGAPVIDQTGRSMNLLWAAAATLGKDGRSILGPADIQRVHAAAIAHCDMDDGIKDGIIGNPRACAFDPAELLCRTGEGTDCLTQLQVIAVKNIYAGPRTSTGEKIYTGGAVLGSELNWIGSYIDPDSGLPRYPYVDLFRYMGFASDPGPSWMPADFDFDRDHRRLGMMEALYSGSNPDLRKFKAAGGKLIVYQGWADEMVVPLNIIDYYETAEKTMGGRKITQDFFRLFMIPGMNHCSGGAGAFVVDYLSHLEAWVERGEAPDVMIGAHPVSGDSYNPSVKFPLDRASVKFTRPVYPYPLQAKYKGYGDVNNAENFDQAR